MSRTYRYEKFYKTLFVLCIYIFLITTQKNKSCLRKISFLEIRTLVSAVKSEPLKIYEICMKKKLTFFGKKVGSGRVMQHDDNLRTYCYIKQCA